MTVFTRHRSMLVLAFLAAVGTGLLIAGRALAQSRISPRSKQGILTFNPFQPTRTTIQPLEAEGPATMPTAPALLGTTTSDPPTPPMRRPPIRDPFRPPTRSPVAPILGTD